MLLLHFILGLPWPLLPSIFPSIKARSMLFFLKNYCNSLIKLSYHWYSCSSFFLFVTILTQYILIYLFFYTSVIEAEQFAVFYQCWQEVKVECLSLTIPDIQLDPSECFIKMSPMTKTNIGTCRLGLTQKRFVNVVFACDRVRNT